MKEAEALTRLFAQVESPTFAAELELATNERMFFEILSSHPVLDGLTSAARTDPKSILKALTRVASEETDPAYSNPYDTAIAAYAWALRDTAFASRAIARIRKAERVWWAAVVARRLEVLVAQRCASSAGSAVSTVFFHPEPLFGAGLGGELRPMSGALRSYGSPASPTLLQAAFAGQNFSKLAFRQTAAVAAATFLSLAVGNYEREPATRCPEESERASRTLGSVRIHSSTRLHVVGGPESWILEEG